MAENSGQVLSRRKWLDVVSTPALAATLFPPRAGGAVPAAPAAGGNDAGARLYNIRDFGAKGDGTTLDTAALQAAIDACARDGGGTVLVPAGTFQIGTVELKSNLTLHLAASATLLGGGQVKNIAVSNCVIYEACGCPIKIGAGGMQLENLSFSNIIMQNVTGPIGINFSTRGRNETGGAASAPAPFVRNISFNHIRATVVQDALLTAARVLTPAATFLQVEGGKNAGITIDGGDLSKAAAPVTFKDGATDNAVRLRG